MMMMIERHQENHHDGGAVAMTLFQTPPTTTVDHVLSMLSPPPLVLAPGEERTLHRMPQEGTCDGSPSKRKRTLLSQQETAATLPSSLLSSTSSSSSEDESKMKKKKSHRLMVQRGDDSRSSVLPYLLFLVGNDDDDDDEIAGFNDNKMNRLLNQQESSNNKRLKSGEDSSDDEQSCQDDIPFVKFLRPRTTRCNSGSWKMTGITLLNNIPNERCPSITSPCVETPSSLSHGHPQIGGAAASPPVAAAPTIDTTEQGKTSSDVRKSIKKHQHHKIAYFQSNNKHGMPRAIATVAVTAGGNDAAAANTSDSVLGDTTANADSKAAPSLQHLFVLGALQKASDLSSSLLLR